MAEPQGAAGPLAGVRVADFTWVIAGPLLTKYLALLGAEVIRVESQRRPEFRERGGHFALLNDSKLSCSLDLSHPRGRDLAGRLVGRCDVVVENFGTGVMDRLGLGYDTLRQVRPDLVMLSCSGLGRSGPDRDKLAFGTLLQLASGWSLLQGHPGADEILIGGAWTDPLAAAYGAFAVLAALHHRRRTGQGQFIDFSMVEATLGGLPEALMDFSMNRRLAQRLGNRDEAWAPQGCYPCRGEDQWLALSVRNEQEWQGLRAAMGDPAWAQAPRFADAALRKQHEDDLDRHLAAWTAQHERYPLMEVLQAHGVPAGPTLSASDLLADPHLRARGAFPATAAPLGGPRATIGASWRIHPALTPRYTPAPRLGQHNAYVFQALLGLSEAEIAELEAQGIAS